MFVCLFLFCGSNLHGQHEKEKKSDCVLISKILLFGETLLRHISSIVTVTLQVLFCFSQSLSLSIKKGSKRRKRNCFCLRFTVRKVRGGHNSHIYIYIYIKRALSPIKKYFCSICTRIDVVLGDGPNKNYGCFFVVVL